MEMTAPDVSRLTHLEVKMAFSERLVSDLDDAVRQMSGDLEILRREVARLRRIIDTHDDRGTPPANEKPPHY